MCRFHLTCNFIVALLGGLADELSLPHEFVPVDAARAPLAALAACFVRALVIAPTFVDHDFSFLPLPFGLPPFLAHLLRVALSCFAARALPPLRPAFARNSRMILS